MSSRPDSTARSAARSSRSVRSAGSLVSRAERSRVATAMRTPPRRCVRARRRLQLRRHRVVGSRGRRGTVPRPPVRLLVQHRRQRRVGGVALRHRRALLDRGAHQRMPERHLVVGEIKQLCRDRGREVRDADRRARTASVAASRTSETGRAVVERGHQQRRARGRGQSKDAVGERALEPGRQRHLRGGRLDRAGQRLSGVRKLGERQRIAGRLVQTALAHRAAEPGRVQVQQGGGRPLAPTGAGSAQAGPRRPAAMGRRREPRRAAGSAPTPAAATRTRARRRWRGRASARPRPPSARASAPRPRRPGSGPPGRRGRRPTPRHPRAHRRQQRVALRVRQLVDSGPDRIDEAVQPRIGEVLLGLDAAGAEHANVRATARERPPPPAAPTCRFPPRHGRSVPTRWYRIVDEPGQRDLALPPAPPATPLSRVLDSRWS